jgi:hypothetical protein
MSPFFFGNRCCCGSDCGSICRTNLRDLSVDNFDFLFSWDNSSSGGTVGAPVITTGNDGTDLLFRLQWQADGVTWASYNQYPFSFARVIALDTQVYTASDFGLPWLRRDYWRYISGGSNTWQVNGTDYISRRYTWDYYYNPRETSSGTHYVGSPCVYAVIESNGILFHCVGRASGQDGTQGPGFAYAGRPWIGANTSSVETACLIT